MPLHGPAYEPENRETVEENPIHFLRDGWRYEASDFGNGYLLYPPGYDEPMRDVNGHFILYYTVRQMTAYTFRYERERQEAEEIRQRHRRSA